RTELLERAARVLARSGSSDDPETALADHGDRWLAGTTDEVVERLCELEQAGGQPRLPPAPRSRPPRRPPAGPTRADPGTRLNRTKEIAEPVALSSTGPTDLPLAGTALTSGFVLLALRARRMRNLSACPHPIKARENGISAICARLLIYRASASSTARRTRTPARARR